jgi:hypothetical protein
MTRRPPAPPEDRLLSVHEMRAGIERLSRRIEELKKLDPQSVSARRSPAVVSLEAAIEDSLAAIFGHGTPKFNRYRAASDLEPTLIVTPLFVGPRGSFGGGGENVHELQQGIAQRKQQALALLEQAVRGLEEEIEHRQPEPAAYADDAASERSGAGLSDNAIFVVHGHREGPRDAVARKGPSVGTGDREVLHRRRGDRVGLQNSPPEVA